MFHDPDLKLIGTAYANGQPITCTHCGDTTPLHIHKTSRFETWPAFVSCLACGKGDDSAVITNGLVDAALAARTGRHKTADRDTFAAEWRGITMTGELDPEIITDDLVQVAQVYRDTARSEASQWWSGKKKAGKTRARAAVKSATGKAAGAATGAASTAKAKALAAAWKIRTGDAGPAPKPRARRCTVAGCRRGMVTLTTRVHSPTGRTRKIKVPCAVCQRAST
ncbi:hypothetical protein ABZ752_22800 [Streptomyces roseifaciens]